MKRVESPVEYVLRGVQVAVRFSFELEQPRDRAREHVVYCPREVHRRDDVEPSTASRAITALEEDGVLEEVTGKARNKEYRAKEIFEILERPPQVY